MSARLDRLPPTRYFSGLVARIAIGGWFEFYEMFMAAYISLGLISSGLYRATTAGLFDVNGFASFLGSFFAGMFVGTVALGGFTDRFGRRAVFTVRDADLLGGDLRRGVPDLAANDGSLALLRGHRHRRAADHCRHLHLRADAVTRRAARYMAFSILVILTSVPVVAVLSYRLVPHAVLGLDGWRWVMIIGSAGAVLIWFMRRGLPESPRWLESKGRVAEAHAIVDAIEAPRDRGNRARARSHRAPDTPDAAVASAGLVGGNVEGPLSEAHGDAVALQLLPDLRRVRLRRVGAGAALHEGHHDHALAALHDGDRVHDAARRARRDGVAPSASSANGNWSAARSWWRWPACCSAWRAIRLLILLFGGP